MHDFNETECVHNNGNNDDYDDDNNNNYNKQQLCFNGFFSLYVYL
jgi:hypothetical protein